MVISKNALIINLMVLFFCLTACRNSKEQTDKETKEEKDEYFRHEISTGNYLRTVTLPAPVDENNIKAKFNNGMLEVTMPKLEK